MQLSIRSRRNMATAYSWDVWSLDPEPGFILALFRYGRSSVVNGPGRNGPVIFPTEADAVSFAMENIQGRRRQHRDPCTVNQNQHPNPVTPLDEAKA